MDLESVALFVVADLYEKGHLVLDFCFFYHHVHFVIAWLLLHRC